MSDDTAAQKRDEAILLGITYLEYLSAGESGLPRDEAKAAMLDESTTVNDIALGLYAAFNFLVDVDAMREGVTKLEFLREMRQRFLMLDIPTADD